jgi:hypothetical protein
LETAQRPLEQLLLNLKSQQLLTLQGVALVDCTNAIASSLRSLRMLLFRGKCDGWFPGGSARNVVFVPFEVRRDRICIAQ